MENATKALIIAASVLIVIILIAMSIKILSAPKSVINQTDTVSSNLEISMFNSQFESYFGTNVSGTQVKSLISKVIVNNSQNPNHTIDVAMHNASGARTHTTHGSSNKLSDLQQINGVISNNKSYIVRVNNLCETYSNGYKDGYIACIYLQEN